MDCATSLWHGAGYERVKSWARDGGEQGLDRRFVRVRTEIKAACPHRGSPPYPSRPLPRPSPLSLPPRSHHVLNPSCHPHLLRLTHPHPPRDMGASLAFIKRRAGAVVERSALRHEKMTTSLRERTTLDSQWGYSTLSGLPWSWRRRLRLPQATPRRCPRRKAGNRHVEGR